MGAVRRWGPGRAERLIAAVIAFVAVAVYANSLSNGFALDDGPILQRNHQLLSLAHLPRFFEQDYFEPSMRMGLYRPLVVSSYALTVAVAGQGPFAFHLVNVLLHATNALLLFWLLLRLGGDRLRSGAAGLLFAAHAVHTEAVANITFGRPELMATCFGLVALHGWLAARPSESRRPGLAQAISLAAFGLAILSKESAVSLIGVAAAIDWLYPAAPLDAPRRGLIASLRRSAGPLTGWALVIGACAGLRLAALGDQPLPPVPFVDNPLGALPPGWAQANALLVMLRYGGLLLFPARLVSDYSFATIPLVNELADPALWLGAVLLAALQGLFAWTLRRDRDACFGLCFAAITFLPASNLLLPIGTILGERLLYLPSAGFCLAAVALLQRCLEGLPIGRDRRAAIFAGVLVLCVGLHAGRAITRNRVWLDDATLRFHDVALHPESVKLLSNAGASHLDRGEPDRALAFFDAALQPEITPGRFINPYQGKVTALVELGRYAEARDLYAVVSHYGPPNPDIERRIADGLSARRGARKDPSRPPAGD
jgi:hypothetical protein